MQHRHALLATADALLSRYRDAPAPPRVLIIPGLRNSGPRHWQTWLESRVPGARRVEQSDWHTPDLTRWSDRIGEALFGHEDTPWIAVAHSFGCLALAHHLQAHPDSPVRSALLVAPAEPDKFQVADALPHHPVGRSLTLVLSENDPWMTPDSACRWARRWGASHINLGQAGHINDESGHHAWPLALWWVKGATARLIQENAARAQERPTAQGHSASRWSGR